jgi:hypothetical protein
MSDNQNVEQQTPEEDDPNQIRFDIDNDVLVLPPLPEIGD